MDPDYIVNWLAEAEGLPREAIRAARRQRAEVAPLLIAQIKDCARGIDLTPEDANLAFFAFHLLGEWREREALRPVCALLRRPPDEVKATLGDAVTENMPRVVAGLFGGDPAPLVEAILDPAADEYVRGGLIEALVILTLRGELARADVAAILGEVGRALEGEPPSFAICSWVEAVAQLGLAELAPQAHAALARGAIDSEFMTPAEFETRLARGPLPAGADELEARRLAPWDDTIAGLERWYGFSAEFERSKRARADAEEAALPAVNLFRDVGRNDPCPCGSGRKFKRCCGG